MLGLFGDCSVCELHEVLDVLEGEGCRDLVEGALAHEVEQISCGADSLSGSIIVCGCWKWSLLDMLDLVHFIDVMRSKIRYFLSVH